MGVHSGQNNVTMNSLGKESIEKLLFSIHAVGEFLRNLVRGRKKLDKISVINIETRVRKGYQQKSDMLYLVIYDYRNSCSHIYMLSSIVYSIVYCNIVYCIWLTSFLLLALWCIYTLPRFPLSLLRLRFRIGSSWCMFLKNFQFFNFPRSAKCMQPFKNCANWFSFFI